MSSSSLATLLKNAHISAPEDFLETANAALKDNKSDLTAQRVRLVALLKLERYDDALGYIEQCGSSLQNVAPLEHAYALYKSNRFEDAQKIAHASDKDNKGLSHVAAQAAYRKEAFAEAASIYKELAASQGDNFDLRIQRSAVDAQLEWSGSREQVVNNKPQREDLDAFESAYNAACGCIARGEFSQAGVLLNRANQLCNASQDLTDEDKAIELIPISIQQSYVALVLGQHDEANKIINNIDIHSISDYSLQRIARVNSLASNSETNSFLVHRLFHSTPPIPTKDAPFKFQDIILKQNDYALDLQNSKFAGISKSTAAINSEQSHPTNSAVSNTLSVINAAATSHNQQGSHAIKAIKPLLESQPTNVGLILLVVQLHTLKNGHCSAIVLLERFLKQLDDANKSIRFAPGLVATAVTLYNYQGRTSQSRSLLAAAASYWRQAPTSAGSAPSITLLQAAGSALLQTGNKDDAAAAKQIFADLHSRNAGDKTAAAGLVAATCLADASRPDESLLKSLSPPSRLTSTIDASALEAAGIARARTAASTATKKRTTEAAASAADTTTRKRRRLPKSRIPREYAAGKELDPERWLPLRDRSTWKPKGGRKAKAKAATLTQGGVVDDDKQQQQLQIRPNSSKPTAGGAGGQAKKNTKKKAKSGRR